MLELDFGHNFLTDAGAQALAGLCQMKGLKELHLHLGHNEISSEAMQELRGCEEAPAVYSLRADGQRNLAQGTTDP